VVSKAGVKEQGKGYDWTLINRLKKVWGGGRENTTRGGKTNTTSKKKQQASVRNRSPLWGRGFLPRRGGRGHRRTTGVETEPPQHWQGEQNPQGSCDRRKGGGPVFFVTAEGD